MNQTLNRPGLPPVPPEVWTFAAEQGASDYVYPLIELMQRLFPGRTLTVLLEEDPEIANDRHIVIEADVTGMTSEQIFEAQTGWGREIFRHCPATRVSIFRCGLAGTA
jgi:hypothetical protein